MKLTDLYKEIINEAYTSSDLKNLGAKIKQGITNIGNKSINVDFSGGDGKGKIYQSKMEKLASDVGFEIPQSTKKESVNKALGPFTDLSNVKNLTSFLQISTSDMDKLKQLKSCFGKDFVISTDGHVIKINNWVKYEGHSNDYVYEYKKLNDSILYFSKKNHPTVFYIEKNMKCFNGGEKINKDDIEIIQRLFNITNVKLNTFKKININIIKVG